MRNTIILISILIIFLLLKSCTKKDNNGFWVFKIKEGKHRSTNKIKYICKNSLNFDLMLTESCKYQSKSLENQYDVNKIFGISDEGGHMENSARVGWRYLNDKIELMAFIHNNGVFSFEKICDAEPNVVYNCNINLLDDKYEFIINNNIIIMDRYKNNKRCKYLLYPYFGGDELAPHDIEIKIKLNK
jgi:hypothetical protein